MTGRRLISRNQAEKRSEVLKMRNDFYVGIYEDQNFLAHHGRLHQKWGVRNGPPYPLDREAVSKAYGKGAHSSSKKKGHITTSGSGLTSYHDQQWDEVWYDDNTGITSFAGRRAQKAYDEMMSRYNEEIEEDPDVADYYLKQNENRLYNAARNGTINPGYGQPGTISNCTKASVMCELVKRGLSGFSAGRQSQGSEIDAEEYWFDGAKTENKSFDESCSFFDSLKPGSSGTLDVFGDGFGHTLHYMCTRDNYIRITDGQNGEVFDSDPSLKDEGRGKSVLDSWFGKHSNFSSSYNMNITDLDNCEPNWDHIAEDGVIRGNRLRNETTRKVVDRW